MRNAIRVEDYIRWHREWHRHLEQADEASFNEEYACAEAGLKAAIKVGEQMGFPDYELSIALHRLAVLYHDQGRTGEAADALERLLGIKEAQFGPEDAVLRLTLRELAALRLQQERANECEQLLQRALDIQKKATGLVGIDAGILLNDLAFLYDFLERDSAAAPLRDDARKLLETDLAEAFVSVGSQTEQRRTIPDIGYPRGR